MHVVGAPKFWFLFVCFALALLLVKITRINRIFPLKQERLSQVDGLRGILAMSVFYHHFTVFYQWRHTGLWTSPPSNFYSLLGPFGVVVFFMITGFLFFGKIKAVRGHMDFNKFYVSRLFRLYPVFLLSVFAMYIVALCKTHFKLNGPLFDPLDSWFFFQQAAINGIGETGAFNASVQWTLTYEWFFYLLLPIVAYFWRKLDLSPWVIFYLAVIMLYFRYAPCTIPIVGLDSSLLAPFALGGLVSEVSRIKIVRTHANTTTTTVLLGILLAVFLSNWSTAYSMSAYIVLAVMFLPICAGNNFFGFLNSGPMVFLGEISYDIYLFHGIVNYSLYVLILPGVMDGNISQARLFWFMLLATVVTVAVSSLAHFLVERPFLNLGASITRKDRIQELAAP
jgi:peptidoglycan/LPS O-acetylase OafA/YrhL